MLKFQILVLCFIGYESFYCITVEIMQFPVLDFDYQYYLDYSFVENVLVCAVEDYVLPANIVLTSFCLFVILIRSLRLNWEALQVSTAKQVLN